MAETSRTGLQLSGLVARERNVALIAQLVEHLTCNQGVRRSSRRGGTKISLKFQGFGCLQYPLSRRSFQVGLKVGPMLGRLGPIVSERELISSRSRRLTMAALPNPCRRSAHVAQLARDRKDTRRGHFKSAKGRITVTPHPAFQKEPSCVGPCPSPFSWFPLSPLAVWTPRNRSSVAIPRCPNSGRAANTAA
jgi:hypothetical protein